MSLTVSLLKRGVNRQTDRHISGIL